MCPFRLTEFKLTNSTMTMATHVTAPTLSCRAGIRVQPIAYGLGALHRKDFGRRLICGHHPTQLLHAFGDVETFNPIPLPLGEQLGTMALMLCAGLPSFGNNLQKRWNQSTRHG